MNRPKLVPSTLKVTASEDLVLHPVVASEHCKSIDELLNEQEDNQEKEKNKQEEQEDQKEDQGNQANQEKSE